MALLTGPGVICVVGAFQVGSFVPAASARMHVFDAVFTRMGASDNLKMGRSTFLEVRATPFIGPRLAPLPSPMTLQRGQHSSSMFGLAAAAQSCASRVQLCQCVGLR